MVYAPRYRKPEPALISPWGPYWMEPEKPATSEFYEPDFSKEMPGFPSPLPPKSMNEPFWQELAKNPELTKKFGMLAPDMPRIRTIERQALYPEDQEGGKSRYPQQRPSDQSSAPIFDDQGNPYTPPSLGPVTATVNPEWKSPAETYQEWKDQRERERAGPSNPFNMVRPEREPGGLPAQQTRYDPLIRGRPDSPFPPTGLPGQQSTQGVADIFGGGPGPVSPQSAQSTADIFNSPAAPAAGMSISDLVRGNRYTNMSPEDRQALLQTIAGEIDPRRTRYGTPEADQEIANIVETVTNRAARSGKSIEDTVKERSQYSTWNKPQWRSRAQENLEQFGPDIRRAVSGAITGDIPPTHEGLTHYHANQVKPNWASDQPAAVVGPHLFYNDVYPRDTSQLPPAPPGGAITSNDLPTPPPPTSLIAGRPESPFGPGSLPAAPPPPLIAGRPESPLGPGSLPPAGPTPPAVQSPFTPESGMPASPTERMETGLATPQIGDPALQQALGPRAPLIAPPAPLRGPPLADPSTDQTLAIGQPPRGIDLGRGQFGPLISEGPAIPRSVVTPQTPLHPEDSEGLPAGGAPLIAPPAPVTPRRTVTPQTPVSPEPESNLPPLPSTTVPDLPVAAAPAPAGVDTSAPLIAPSSDYAGPTAKSRRTGLGPFNIFDREHYVGGPGLTASPSTIGTDYIKSATPGRGKYKPAEHERLARNIGKTAGLAASIVGVPPIVGVPAFGMAAAMANRAIDPNRQVFERGPFRFLGNIFGGGLGRKDKKKSDDEKLGTPPSSEPAGVKEAAAAASRSGLGSDRGYSGGTYGGGYGPGLRDLIEGVGGAYRNR